MKSRASGSRKASLTKPSGPTTIERVTRPFQEFSESEAAGGVLLLAAAALALAWANSPWAESYSTLWEHKFTIGFEGFALSKSILHWINDGLMAIFFFVVGLEIKRELLVGELASPRQAALPIVGALGGVVVPALLYFSLNAGGPGAAGWGIPIATDIAFAMGAMALLGSRVPVGLKVFLTALAIVDDIVAVLVIAIFYTGNLSWPSLGVAGGFFAALLAASILGMRHPLPYALLGVCMWVAMLLSGVHATIAGVLLALAVPAQPRIDVEKFIARGRRLLDQMEYPDDGEEHILRSEARQVAVMALEDACEKVETPLQRFEHTLLPWVRLIIMPVFALANAGVALGTSTAAATQPYLARHRARPRGGQAHRHLLRLVVGGASGTGIAASAGRLAANPRRRRARRDRLHYVDLHRQPGLRRTTAAGDREAGNFCRLARRRRHGISFALQIRPRVNRRSMEQANPKCRVKQRAGCETGIKASSNISCGSPTPIDVRNIWALQLIQ